MILSALLSWAVVTLSSGFMRQSPDYESPLENQLLMGALVETLDTSRYWVKVKAEDYTGWVNELGLKALSDSEKEAYLLTPKLICVAPYAVVREAPSEKAAVMCDFCMGDLVRAFPSCFGTPACAQASSSATPSACPRASACARNTASPQAPDSRPAPACAQAPASAKIPAPVPGWLPVLLPDGRKGWVLKHEVMDFRALASLPPCAEGILSLARSFRGTPYMWGGNSNKYFDCSGLVKFCFFMNSVLLPRNASQQAACGEPVKEGCYAPGDLLFFGRRNPLRVSHVGIYAGDGMFVHASQMVRVDSLAVYGREVVAARRILGTEGSGKGAVRVLESPYYFKQ